MNVTTFTAALKKYCDYAHVLVLIILFTNADHDEKGVVYDY